MRNETVRSLLAFMNIPEFDADVSRRLFARAQKTAGETSFSLFQKIVLAAAMWLSSAAFYQAMSLYLQTCEAGTLPLVRAGAGLAVLLFAASVALLIENPVGRRFVWSVALGAEFLFLSGVYALSPLSAVACAAVVAWRANGGEKHAFEQISATCVFAATLALSCFLNNVPHASFWVALPTFALGAAEAVCPSGKSTDRATAAVLLLAAPLAFTVLQAAELAGFSSAGTAGGAAVFVAGAVGLTLYVRRYMDEAERKSAVRTVVAVALAACFLPAAAIGAPIAAVIGGLIDFPALFYAGIVLFAASFALFVLATPVSFGAAAVVFFAAGLAALFLSVKAGKGEK